MNKNKYIGIVVLAALVLSIAVSVVNGASAAQPYIASEFYEQDKADPNTLIQAVSVYNSGEEGKTFVVKNIDEGDYEKFYIPEGKTHTFALGIVRSGEHIRYEVVVDEVGAPQQSYQTFRATPVPTVYVPQSTPAPARTYTSQAYVSQPQPVKTAYTPAYSNSNINSNSATKYSWNPNDNENCWSTTNNLGGCTGKATIGLLNGVGHFMEGFFNEFI